MPLLHYNLSSLRGATPGAIPSDLLNPDNNDEQLNGGTAGAEVSGSQGTCGEMLSGFIFASCQVPPLPNVSSNISLLLPNLISLISASPCSGSAWRIPRGSLKGTALPWANTMLGTNAR